MQNPETMRVKCEVSEDNDQGFYLINKDDFNPDVHTPFDEVKVDVKKEADPVVKPAWQA